jgi:ribosomal protein S27AE
MSNPIDTTIHVRQRPEQCPECGYFVAPDETYCPKCGYEFTQPVAFPEAVSTTTLSRHPAVVPHEEGYQDYFSPRASAILQFLPSATCVTLVLNAPVVLGRDAPNGGESQLDLTEFNALAHGVSRRHCILRRTGDCLVIRDLGSTNGTYLNNERLNPSEDYVVANGDRVILGSLHIAVWFNTAD